MRRFVARTPGAVLLLLIFFLLSVFVSGQSQGTGKPNRAAKRTSSQATVKADRPAAIKAKTPLPTDRKSPSLQQDANASSKPVEAPGFRVMSHPREDRLVRGHSFEGDLRTLPQVPPEKFERPEFEGPQAAPVLYPGTPVSSQQASAVTEPNAPLPAIPAPTPAKSFEGLDFANWGAGHPPDTNGDVGPTYYIQTINTAVGIYKKSDGSRAAAFTFNTLMSQGAFGNLCDTNNFGDPVVLYDTFEDRWVITDFAFTIDGSGNISNPPGMFQCFAVSKSGDPVSGGWNFYSVHVTDFLGDYPKFGVWPDGIYWAANMFGFPASGTFQNARVWALNKAQMYAGAATVQILSFDAPSAEFTLLPSNARLQTGTPPAGSPNYFATVFNFLNVVSVYKLHADWNNISTSTFSGPFQSLTATSWSQFTGANGDVPSPNNALDTLYPRLMMQNQYTNFGGVESLWSSHTVGASGATSAQAAVRYYQVGLTGGNVAASAAQAFTYSPDTTVHRFMPSAAVDRAGDMAIGYSASSATLNPAIRYAGRLGTDPINSITQTETSLIAGTGSQSGSCGGTCTRWGDYSAMTLDPDGCTFWYTNMYYQVIGLNFNTRVGAFKFPSCTPVATGTVAGTVTAAGSGNPISGATVALGSRTTTTAIDGTYSFTGIASGTYPSISASISGFNSATTLNVVVTDGAITTVNFALTAAATSGCLTDTTQADFQAGVPSNCDLTGSPGNVTLLNAANIDQQNTSVTFNGFAVTATSWAGQTFRAGVTGQLTRVDLDLFCSGCTGTTPNITVSIRATTGNPALPTGPDLATATIAGFSSGAGGFFTANFSSPPTLTAGTTYAVIFRPVSNPSAGSYAYVCSCSGGGAVNSNPYANGRFVTSANSGGAWAADNPSGGRDMGFKVFMKTGFPPSGTFVSSLKDANPAPGFAANWSTLSWTATTPANTAIKFQAAASNSALGPFNFVGPDGTAGTFFTSGGSLAQFNGKRYFKYQALLSTTNSAATPTLSDVTVCFNDVPTGPAPTTLTVNPATGAFAGTVNLSATLTSSTGVSGKTVSFTLNGNSVGSGTTDGSGIATVSGVSLVGINAGTYPGGVAASFAGDGSFAASSGSATLTVTKANQTISFAALAGKTFGDPDFSVSATASSGLAVTFAASGNCTVTGSTVHITGTGSCTITASQAGDSNYNAAPDVPQTFSIIKASQNITKSFGAATIALNGTTSLTFTIQNPNSSATLTGLSFTDNLPGGLTVAQTPNLSSTCGGTATAVAGAGQVILTGGTLAATQTCNVLVDVQGTTAGVKNNSVQVTSTEGGTGNTSNAAITVVAPPVLSKAFNPTVIASGATANLIFTVTNPPVNPVPLTGVGFNDTLPAGVVLTSPLTTTVSCPGSVTALSGGGSVSFAGGSIPVNSSCTITVLAVRAFAPGVYKNTTDAVTSTNGGTGNTASADLTVSKIDQTITFGALANKVFGDLDFSVSATASSGLTVTFAASGNCTVAGSTVHITGAGSCTITASQAGDANYNPAPDVPRSFTIAKAGQTITFGALANKNFGDPDFTVSATASSGLAVTFAASGSCSVTGSTVHLTGAGSCTITASQAGNANYNPAPDVPQSFTIAKAGQTITFGPLSNKNFGDPDFGVSATASSGLAVTFAASGSCTVTGATVHLTGAGSCTITASQAGNANYSAAVDVPQSFTIAKGNQTITFAALANKTFGDPDFTVSASASSGLAVTFAAGGSCTVTGSTVHITASGSCTITASQAGDANYNAAPDVPQSFTIGKASQTITFGALAGKTFGDTDFSVSATASSGLAVTFAAAGNCSITGSTVHITGAGSCTITASQAGDTNYNAAPDVPQTFAIAKANQTITFGALAGKTFGDPDFSISATASSGLAVTFAVAGKCSITGSSVHITGAGSCTITASQAGDANYNAAPDVPQSFTIAKANQTITFGALTNKTFGDADFSVSGTASSGLTVAFAASGSCTVTGSTVHITGAGSCTVTALQAGDANYNAAPDVPQSFTIAKAGQTISFGPLGNKNFGDPDFTVSATASSGLAVTFAASGSCTVAGATVHLTGAGSCTITASQAGNANFNPAADVPQSFTIAKGNQTISFAPLANKSFGDPDFLVSATASSGLAVTFAASGSCTVTGFTVHITGPGSCTITASQAGNANFNAAPDVPQSFTIGKASQTITFAPLANKTFGDPDFTVSATASSGLAVAFAASGNCTVTGSTVHLTGAGTCTVTASQAGDANYNAAPDVPQSFTIGKAGQTITFGALANKSFGDPDFTVSASASSGLAVTFGAAGSCTVAGSMVHITGAGSCTITASQAGDANYNAAPDVAQSFTIGKASQTITFGAQANKSFGDPDFTVNATASSVLAVTFAASGSCTVAGSTVHLTGAGSCTITASQAGNANYNAAADVPQSFTIAKGNQTITFAPLPNKSFGDPDFLVSATASSGLAVTFAASGSCTVTGSTVHITGSGSCTITASQAGSANFNAAPDVPQSFTSGKASQAITFAPLANKTFGNPDFTVGATASSGLAVSFAATGNCSLSGSTVHITGAGSCTITASQAGDANYNAATDVPQSFTIAKASQTITFGALANKSFGDPDFGVSATAFSGLAVTFAATGNCSVSGSTVHITGAGSCTITASQAGDANYSAAPDVPQSFTIAKGTQTITFGPLANKNFGDPDFGVSATASSGLAVTFTAGGNCSVSGSTVHLTGAGSCTITASQAGDANYNAATDVPQSFTIAKGTQTITFAPLANKSFGDLDFGVSATASSGLSVSFAASGNCSVAGASIHIIGAGSCTITASQGGNADYKPAADVPQSFTIGKASQSIAFAALANKTIGDPDFSVSATASSALAVTFAASGNCTVTGSTVHLTGAGSCTITASQPGDANYNAAIDVPQSFSIAKLSQSITFGALAGKTFGDPDFGVSATATSGLGVSFAAAGNCAVAGSTVHITGAGSCTITASQPGDATYSAAADVPQAFTIAKAGQAIIFGALSGKTFGDPDFSVSATASSGLAVTFTASGKCSVSGSSVHLTGAGSCTITASQAGGSNYNPAADVPQTFTIAKAAQTITFAALANKLVGDPDFNVSATASSGLAVTFSAGGVCTVSGATVHLTGAGSCTITASQAGDSNFNAATNVPQSFNVSNPDFALSPTLASITVKAGQSGTEHITFTPNPAISNALNFACTGLPALSSCTFSPATVPAGSTQVDVVLTIGTTAPTGAAPSPSLATWMPFGFGFGLIGVVVMGTRGRSRKVAMSFVVLAFTLTLLIGCGGRPSANVKHTPGTPPGTYPITVTGTSGSVSHSASFNLTVN